MDENISPWIFDFLLRQPHVDDRTLSKLITVLPLPIHDSGLMKAMLLRKLVSEISKGIASEQVLVLMEQIEELDYRTGVVPSEAMKAAYCDVAVDCTVKLLLEESEDGQEKYFKALRKIWRGRVLTMEMAGNVGLVSDVLLEWRDDIEASMRDASVYELLLKKWRGLEALTSVRVYVAEAWEKMGPSFLELVVRTIGGEEITNVLKHGTCPINDQGQCHNPIEVQSSDSEAERSHVATRIGRGATISDLDSQDGRAATENAISFIPEVNKMQEALRASCSDLQAVVNDPLPEAIQLADNLISRCPGDNLDRNCAMEERRTDAVVVENPSANKNEEAIAVNETLNNAEAIAVNETLNNDEAIAVNETLNNDRPDTRVGKKPCLMERNSTARVYEWDESLDGVVAGSSERNVPHLPATLKRSRRTKIRWSPLEEDTLKSGVEKYGKGNWKFILNAYKDSFNDRTEVDLKDKWRNMTKR